MANICVVYAREDIEIAEIIVNHLSSKWIVWWDYNLTGDFQKKIPSEIKKSDCVVALWSVAAVEKTSTVGEEMRIALENDVEIIPVEISTCEPMFGYGHLSRVTLTGWGGNSQHPEFLRLMSKLSTIIPPLSKPPRLESLANKHVQVPSVFLSISSHETRLDPLPAMQAVYIYQAPTVLISAFE